MKLLRELWHSKGQMLSIALVVATGIMTVITMRGSYESLVEAQRSYYAQARFADVWASLKRAPDRVRRQLQALPGVTAVDTRVSFYATLDLPDVDAPAQAQFVSVPEFGRPMLNDLHLIKGRYLVASGKDEALISNKFAQARGMGPGDTLRALINGRARDLTIVGVALSPEFTYAVPPGALFADDEHFGVIWMSEAALGPAFDMDGAFNQALLRIDPEANPDAVLSQVDEVLDRYGGLGAYGRDKQMSHQILQGELDQNRVMGTALPAVFLAVAAFLLNLVLSRLVATQRTEIAVLKAFGYSNREVGSHYLQFALVAVVIGTLAGTAAGVGLGHSYVELYGQYFDFPVLRYQLSGSLLSVAIGVSMIAAASGALLAVRKAIALPPAEAMRPEPPARFHSGWLERSWLLRSMPAALKMIARNMSRRPLQSLMSSLGVAFSVAILVVGMFTFDGVVYMMDLQFKQVQREDITVSFVEPVDAHVIAELARLDGVAKVEGFRGVPARLRFGHRHREVGLQGLEADGQLRRVVSEGGYQHAIPATGMLLSASLAKRLGVNRGDSLKVEFLEGRRRHVTVPVAGLVHDFIGLAAYADLDWLNAQVAGPRMASGAFLATESERHRAQLYAELKAMPRIASVSSPQTMLASFEKQMGDSLYVAIGFLLGFAGIIAVAVIYNGARIGLSERGRELASLRVMGFRRHEVSALLLGEQLILTLAAIPLGWVIGYALSAAVVGALQTDAYRIPFVIDPITYLIAAAVTLASALASGLIVRRRIDGMDLIAVLKTRE